MSLKSQRLSAVSALSLNALILSAAPVMAQEADTVAADATTLLSLGRIVVSAGKEKVATDTPQSVTVLDQGRPRQRAGRYGGRTA